jgi:hypothetical protein
MRLPGLLWTLISIFAVTAAQAQLVKNPRAGVLWEDTFDELELNESRHGGWGGLKEPPSASLTVKDGVLTMRETGESSYWPVQRYIPYDLREKGAPYLRIKLLDGPGKMAIANASTGGMAFAENVAGPGLFAVDLRPCKGLNRKKPGEYALSFMIFGPRGRAPGPETRIDWIRTDAATTDLIEVTLEDAQEEGQSGHSYVSIGDRLRFTLNTANQADEVSFQIIDGRTGKPIKIDGRTSFIAVSDADAKGRAWSAEVSVTPGSDRKFKTWYERQGRVVSGRARTHVVATVKGGLEPRLIGAMPCGFDLSAKAVGPKTVAALLAGKELLRTDFDTPVPDGWQPIAGENWVRQRGRYGDLSDAQGPDNLGVWSVNGENWWDDYKLTADMAEELDGAGSVFLAVRFQDPANYYALEWHAAGTDTLRLVRCKDGNRYTIAESEGHKLNEFPFTLSVAASGDYLAGYLNGQQVVTGFAGDFAKGRIALGEMGRKVLMDNVYVERLVTKAKRSRFFQDLSFDYALKPRYFLRDTGMLKLPFTLRNTGKESFKELYVTLRFDDVFEQSYYNETEAASYFPPVALNIKELAAGAIRTIELPIDTRLLKAGEYVLKTQVAVPREGLARDEVIRIGIARNWNPERFNYFTWGLPGKEETLADYASHGHTMGIAGGRATPLDWEYKGKPVPEEAIPERQGAKQEATAFHPFDLALKHGIIAGTNLQTNHGKFFPEEAYGLNRRGDEEKPTPLPLPYHPAFHDFSVNLARTYAEQYHEYPAYRLMNMNTETEHHNQPDFSPIGLERARKLFGGEIPKGCENMYAFKHSTYPGLVKDSVIEDDHPVLRFYRWFWLEGEGFNVMAKDMMKAINEVDPNLLVFHDPAARMPYMRDRHDGMNPWDWTYTTPNPLTLTFKIEAIRGFAEPGNDHIVNYVQVLWKQWTAGAVNLCPSAAVIRLGLLHSSSRPVFAVGHWNTGWMTKAQHLDRWEGVQDLHKSFWKPLGPILTNLKQDAPRRVAFLVSHTNQLFAETFRGSWQTGPALSAWHEAFLRAGLPVDVVYEETVAEGGLKDYTTLFIPFGEVISRSAHKQIAAFAAGGGRVVADHNLGYSVPGVTKVESTMDHMTWPNWGWYRLRHKQGITAPERIKRMWAATAEIARVFAKERSANPVPGDPWLVVNERRWGKGRYLYAINDKRSAGAVGKRWNAILEQGEPLATSISVPTGGTKAVYDLVAHREITPQADAGRLTWQTDFAPASATVFALLPQRIAFLEIVAPKTAERGQPLAITARILDDGKAPIAGLLPIRITIRDGQGAASEYSDTFAMKDGVFTLNGWIALNDTGGTWSVTVEDLASGRTARKYFRVPVR